MFLRAAWWRRLIRRTEGARAALLFQRGRILCGLAVVLALSACTFGSPAPPTSPSRRQSAYPFVGVKPYYLALGDSLAFGFQPDGNFSDGYSAQWYANLQQHGSQHLTNYGCSGETTHTFIHGGCPQPAFRHIQYTRSQLAMALAFLRQHAGQVSPVSLDIGADDLLPDFQFSLCSVKANFQHALAQVDGDLTRTILPQLIQALTDQQGRRTGDLVLMNYYNPFANHCKNSATFTDLVNQHLAHDAAQFHLPLANVYQSFGGGKTPNAQLCVRTWVCGATNGIRRAADIHPTTLGYHLIAQTFATLTGY